ncbi:hypothetical protein KSP40_PGU018582 [Platanthera guangdongensis]|uniref:PPPDE domain-containing protein n=1 Tax=Platanthera guangdongensis TaxID=2320717 RepID=A0ABR2LRV9_9ASPA
MVFGYCENGSGVFNCPPTQNPMYTYRESIILGETDFTNFIVNQILRELIREWVGSSYDLLSRNCNHFCDVFSERLGVLKLPAWVNRFANAGDAAFEAAENTAIRLRQAKTEIVSASKAAYRFLVGVTSNPSGAATESAENSSSSISRFKGASWFKNIIAAGTKPTDGPSDLLESSAATTSSSSSDDELPSSHHKHMEYKHHHSRSN